MEAKRKSINRRKTPNPKRQRPSIERPTIKPQGNPHHDDRE
jgi:hypothetical protein